MARKGHQIDWHLCEKRPRSTPEPPRDDACANVGVATACVVWLTGVRRLHGGAASYSVELLLHNPLLLQARRDRRRHSKQQHVAWHNKRPRLPTVPLNRNNAACVIAEHALLPARLRRLAWNPMQKNRRINYKIRSAVHEINSDVRLHSLNHSKSSLEIAYRYTEGSYRYSRLQIYNSY